MFNIFEQPPVDRRRICFVITNKIHFARSKFILHELRKLDSVQLQIVLAGTALMKDHGDVESLLVAEGLPVSARISMSVQGGQVSMAKTTGLGVIEFASVFENLEPDVVVLRGDRFEVLSAAIAAAYMNKTIAHIEGGDVSGNIDESVRHAITKLSHYHFATNQESADRIVRMGERPDTVFVVGASDVEFANLILHGEHAADITSRELAERGVGAPIDVDAPFVMVMQHPVTSEVAKSREHVIETVEAIRELAIPTVFFWPNIDAGRDAITATIREYRKKHNLDSFVCFVDFLEPPKFLALLNRTHCLIGNSSSGIKECSYLGVPVVNIGNRQSGRLKGDHIVDVPNSRQAIRDAVHTQVARRRYPQNDMYYRPHTSKTIARKISELHLYTQKKFID